MTAKSRCLNNNKNANTIYLSFVLLWYNLCSSKVYAFQQYFVSHKSISVFYKLTAKNSHFSVRRYILYLNGKRRGFSSRKKTILVKTFLTESSTRIIARDNGLRWLDPGSLPWERVSLLDLSNNSLHCDCAMAWMISAGLNLTATCSSPAQFTGLNVQDLDQADIIFY